MSRFDDIAKARARGDSFLASWRRSRSAVPSADGVSRRDVIRKAGLIAGVAVVGSPLIQSVSAAPVAVSQSCSDADRLCGGALCPTSQCTDGGACLTASDCVSGNCTDGVCVTAPIQNGSACGDEPTRQMQDASCASGYCENGTCVGQQSVSNGSSCHGATVDHANAQCGSDSVCLGATDQVPQGYCKKSSGAPCSVAGVTECASGLCPPTGVCA